MNYKRKAMLEVRKAIKRGDIPKASTLSCKECGVSREMDPKIVINYHHEDYDKPLEVIPFCMRCHAKLHAKKRRIGKFPPRPIKKLGTSNIMKIVERNPTDSSKT